MELLVARLVQCFQRFNNKVCLCVLVASLLKRLNDPEDLKFFDVPVVTTTSEELVSVNVAMLWHLIPIQHVVKELSYENSVDSERRASIRLIERS